MDLLADAVAAHLAYQIESGAEAVVLFDTWAASLTTEDYRRYAAPWSRRVLDALEGRAPRVAFAGAADHLVEELAALGPEAIAVDHRTDLAGAFERTGGRVALQGNLDPCTLWAPPAVVERETRRVLDAFAGQRGYIFNLGSGILPRTPVESVEALWRTVLAPATSTP
jgi:uroporphyrinogen decarboxylase